MTGNRLFGLGIGAAIVAIVVFGWLLGISPMLAQADTAALETQSVQAQNAVQQTSLTALKAQFGKLPALKKELATLQQAIPEGADLDDFLDELQLVAQSTGVTIATFTAAEASAYGGPTPSAAATPATTPPAPADGATAAPADGSTTAPAAPTPGTAASGNLAGKLFTIPITIGVNGTSESVMAFVNACQLDKRFFLITSAAFTSAGGTISGYVFVLRDPAALLLESAKPKPTATPTPTPSATPTPAPTPTATPEPDATEEPAP